ncbi:MAG: ABC transporter permease [Muribaculum sp.]|nr:ABC transporter permease [Muribaculum sp.]
MDKLNYIVRVLRHSPWSTAIKVLSLGLGMAMCVFLLDMFLFIVNYDKGYRQSNDIYQIFMQFSFTNTGEVHEPQEQTYGPTARAIYENFPNEVVAAVSTSYRSGNVEYEGRKIPIGQTTVADSLFFETLGIEVLAGNPVKDLAIQDVVYLSERSAKEIFGNDNPIGKAIKLNDIDVTVRGTYKEPPLNSSIRPGAVLSFPTYLNRQWIYYGFNGGDSYPAYVRLAPGTDADDLNKRIANLVNEIQPPRNGTKLDIFIRPLSDTYRGYESTKVLFAVSVILGLALVMVTALNYALMSIASLSKRAKAIGVYKCSGANSSAIAGMFLLETAIILILSTIVAAVVLYYVQKYIEYIESVNVRWILSEYRWSILAVFLALLLLGGLPPARLFGRIPVTQVFRRFTEHNSVWKKVLLFVQFVGITFVSCLLCIVSVQYSTVLNHDLGYDSSHIVFGNCYDIGENRSALWNYIENLPYVESVSRTESIPVYGYSGELVWDGSNEALFSTRINSAASGFVNTMGMHLVAGRDVENTMHNEVVVNEEFMRLMHWNVDSAFSEGTPPEINIGGDIYKVVGVVNDFVIGDYMQPVMPYASINIPANDPRFYTLTLRVKEPVAENAVKLATEIPETFSGVGAWFTDMPTQISNRYTQVRFFRTIILITSIIILFIVLMGLIGFVRDEIQRRSKEIAIRKINGAETSDIIRLLCRDMAIIAVPSVAVGVALAWWAGGLWLERFNISPANLPLYYVVAGIGVLALILACVVFLSRRTALDNPVNAIKSE